MNPHNEQKFRLTYSAKQREEINSIRKKYLPEEEDKMERLRRLDESVTQKPTALAMVFGVLGALVFGGGLCLILCLGGWWIALGIVLGLIGFVTLGCAYPAYQRTLEKEKERVAPEILRLSEELLRRDSKGLSPQKTEKSDDREE